MVKRMYFSSAGVLADHRGNGLQRRLIAVRLRYAKSIGAVEVVTDTRDNPISANNLIACGFRCWTPLYPWSYTDAVYWKKYL